MSADGDRDCDSDSDTDSGNGTGIFMRHRVRHRRVRGCFEERRAVQWAFPYAGPGVRIARAIVRDVKIAISRMSKPMRELVEGKGVIP
jgi:hypothetical protein